MGNELDGRRIAILATDGVEQVELTEPRAAVEHAGAKVDLIAPKTGRIQGLKHLQPGDRFTVDKATAHANPADYDALILPGGVINADALRTDRDAVRFVRALFDARKPVAAICHGPWLLVEAGVVAGRTLTSWPSLRTDIQNAGGHWVDEPVHTDRRLVTSRKPDDLPAFCAKIVEEFSEGRHEEAAPSFDAARDRVDEGSELSFPASDPPSWMPPTTIG